LRDELSKLPEPPIDQRSAERVTEAIVLLDAEQEKFLCLRPTEIMSEETRVRLDTPS
jgi:hypothetical protein